MKLPDQAPRGLTDRAALARQRRRAAAFSEPAWFLHDHVCDNIQERLDEVNRAFHDQAVVAPFGPVAARAFPGARVLSDSETLEFSTQSQDLVVHVLGLHWSNDPVGQLVQCRRALRPDGLFLGACFGGQTLQELRACLADAESRVSGGLAPRIAPMGEVRDYGGLLQRAGFALPVADSLPLRVEYRDAFALMSDLRAMGETNALTDRVRRFTGRAVMTEAARLYQARHATESGRVVATFEIVFLTGWAPAESQPRPLRPGSATTRLADALGTTEHKTDRDDGDI